jgi:hypothetical protein
MAIRFLSERRSRAVSRAIALCLLLGLPASLEAQDHRPSRDQTADSAAVSSAPDRFLTAFENLEWEPFHAAFSDSATVFHPSPSTPERVTGRAAIDSTLRAVFADVRAHAAGGPPYHRLTPVGLRIQALAPGAWRIVHLHASNLPPPSSAVPRSP